MYNTSEEWKTQIYKDVQSVLNIYIDGELINPDYILDFKVGQTLFDEDLSLGTTTSKYIELKIYKDKVYKEMKSVKVDYGILINKSFSVADVNSMLVGTLNGIKVKSLSKNNTSYEMIPIGIFNIDDFTDNDDNTLTVKCIDNMSKFEFKYDGSKLKYPATLLQVLKDICLKAGVELGSTSFLNCNKEIAVYDNTVSAREYLSYIAECAGGFAFIGRDGKLYIKRLYQDEQEIPIDLFGSYKWGEEYKISKVSYEDGIRSFKFGNETRNTLWLNQENMFIVDENQVNNIYNQIKDLTTNSFEGKVIIDPALDVGDKIIIDGKPVIYQGECNFETRFIAEIKSKIAIKQKQETTTKTQPQKVVNRRVQSRIDQAEGKITQLVEETAKQSKKITQVEQTVDGISQKVENIQDFTKEKIQIENLELTDVAEGEGYILKFIVYGNAKLFNAKEITICASQNPRGYGEAIYLTAEDGNELLTEDGQEFIIGEGTYYLKSLKITLKDCLRNLTEDGEEYFDTLEIAQDGAIKVIRRIGVNIQGELYVLAKEQEEILEENFVLPSKKGQTYYFIKEMPGLNYYAQYIIENDYSETFLTKLELGTKIEQNAEAVKVAWNQLSQYLQMEGKDGKATLNIYDKDKNILMSLNQDGENFYDSNNKRVGYIGIVREKEQDTLAFVMDIDWKNKNEGKSMAWGYNDKNGKFLPIFYLSGSYGTESSEYGGELEVVGNLSVGDELKVIKQLTLEDMCVLAIGEYFSLQVTGQSIGNQLRHWITFKTEYGYEFYCNGNPIFSITDNGVFSEKNIQITEDNTLWYPVLGSSDHKFYMTATSDHLYFMIDGLSSYFIAMQQGDYSDIRLKEEIKSIKNNILKSVDNLEIKQFKLKNKNGKISFGIIAQELIESLKEQGIDYEKYDIIHKMLFSPTDKTEYFAVNYNQFLILKQLLTDKKIQEQQEQIEQLKVEIKNLKGEM